MNTGPRVHVLLAVFSTETCTPLPGSPTFLTGVPYLGSTLWLGPNLTLRPGPITPPLLALALPLAQPYSYKVTKLSGRLSRHTLATVRLSPANPPQPLLVWPNPRPHPDTPTRRSHHSLPLAQPLPRPMHTPTRCSRHTSLCWHRLLPHPTLPPAALTKPPSFGPAPPPPPPILQPGAFITP